MISSDKKTLSLHSPLGLPTQLVSIQRILTELGIADDVMFLSIISATCANIDPLHLCRMFHGGQLTLQGGVARNIRVVDTIMVLPVLMQGAMVAEIYVSIVTNDMSFAWRVFGADEESGEPSMEFFPDVVSGPDILAWLTSSAASPTQRLPLLQQELDTTVEELLSSYSAQSTQREQRLKSRKGQK